MSHIDEGRLHAWLDRDRSGISDAEYTLIGSHLGKCAECTARLAEERQIRERSAAILAVGRPATVPLPAFEGLTARAPAPVRRDSRRPMVALAWAASLVAALGAGWLASSLMEREPQLALQTEQTTMEVSQEMSEAAPTMATAPAAPEMADQRTLREAAPTGGPTVGVIAGIPAPQPTAADFSGMGRIGGVAAPEAQEETAQRAPSLSEATTAISARAPASASTSAPAEPPAAQSRATRAEGASASASPAPPAPPPPTPAAAPAPLGVAAFTDAAAPVAWEVVSREEAERRLGARLITHPRLTIQQLQAAPAAGEPVVRVFQTLPGGELLILTLRRPRFDSLPAVETRNSVSVIRGAISVTATAPVSPDSLSTLLGETR